MKYSRATSYVVSHTRSVQSMLKAKMNAAWMLSVNGSQTPERHFTCVSHIISWISRVTWLEPVDHSSYDMNKHRPQCQRVQSGYPFVTLIPLVSLCIWFVVWVYEWLESKRDLWSFNDNAQSSWLWSLLPCVSDEVLSFIILLIIFIFIPLLMFALPQVALCHLSLCVCARVC